MSLIDRVKLSAPSRRRFLWAAGFSAMAAQAAPTAAATGPNVLGPQSGYSPHIGTLVSEMAWMRGAVLRPVQGMKQDELDFLLDPKANRIGALLMHLAATERLYQVVTFEGVALKDLENAPSFKEWKIPMELGGPARETVRGHDLDYYVKALRETREKTLAEFRKRDDNWLMATDKDWPWGPTNNLCKWFHVCEHESHHSGQISLLKGRLPGAKPENG